MATVNTPNEPIPLHGMMFLQSDLSTIPSSSRCYLFDTPLLLQMSSQVSFIKDLQAPKSTNVCNLSWAINRLTHIRQSAAFRHFPVCFSWSPLLRRLPPSASADLHGPVGPYNCAGCGPSGHTGDTDKC